MHLGWSPARSLATLALVSVFCGACAKDDAFRPSTAPEVSGMRSAAAARALSAAPSGANAATSGGQSANGAASQRPVYYDGELFTVNMMELPGPASASIIAHDPTFNEIYATNDLDEEQDFLSVINAVPGDGFNPLWRQNLIVFNPGFTPHQFTSDEEVLAAASGASPEITIVQTDEIYRCAVVGRK
jgi:hypothetical protein